jgi:hypothetical protein
MSQPDPLRSIRIQIDVPVGVEVVKSYLNNRFTITSTVPDADATGVKAAGGVLPSVSVSFSGGVVNPPSALVQATNAPIQPQPPNGVTPGNPTTGNTWSFNNLAGVQTQPNPPGAPNKLIIYWKNSAGGDWELQAWTFSAIA